MKKIFIIDFLVFAIAKTLSFFFCCVALRPALWIGRVMGGLVYILNTKRRSIAYANLKSAFPEKSAREIKTIARRHFENLGMNVVELMKFPIMDKRFLQRYTTIKNIDRIKDALDKGKGIILLTAHFGNWEIGSLSFNANGYRVSVFAREQKYTRLNNLLNRYREIKGSRVITKGFSVRAMIKELHNNSVVAMLLDQDAGANGVFVDFFGRSASVAQGASAFSLRTGAIILPTFVRRIGHHRHLIDLKEPLELINTQDKENDTRANAKKITDILEAYIRRFPEQWLWSHKRWKSTPRRTVLVLNDGRPGHFNQAMAVAEMAEEALGLRLKARGIEEKAVIDIQVREVKFKNRLMRTILDLSSLFAGPRCQGCLRCLRFCLEKESFDKIKNTYADIVVSCGASTVGVNTFLKYENNAKGIVIMKPGLGRARKFDLVVLPRHDASLTLSSPLRGEVLITEAAPNRITEKAMREAVLSAISFQTSDISHQQGIGVLIGGDTKTSRLKKESIEKLIDGVLKIAGEMDVSIFLSTSMRTSPEIETFLKHRLGKDSRCRLLVIANEKNIDGIVPAIFGLSEIIVISPDSVSMISEGASSGKHVVVFKEPELRDCKKKHGASVENLKRKGYTHQTAPGEIYDSLKRILKDKPTAKKLQDREKIIERLKTIV